MSYYHPNSHHSHPHQQLKFCHVAEIIIFASGTTMIYQLPNGKIIHLSVEDYLDLTDQDIQALMSVNAGDHPRSVWHGSVIKSRKRPKPEEEEEEEDKSIDFQEELDEPLGNSGSEESFYEEDFPDFPEDMHSM